VSGSCKHSRLLHTATITAVKGFIEHTPGPDVTKFYGRKLQLSGTGHACKLVQCMETCMQWMQLVGMIQRGARYLTGENLEVVWAEFSTLS
jgi:hypothetical protein